MLKIDAAFLQSGEISPNLVTLLACLLGQKPFRGRINLTAASSVLMKTIRIKSPNKNVETFKLRMLLGMFQGLN